MTRWMLKKPWKSEGRNESVEALLRPEKKDDEEEEDEINGMCNAK